MQPSSEAGHCKAMRVAVLSATENAPEDAIGRFNQRGDHPDRGTHPKAGILAIRERALDLFLHGWRNH
jgi:hypothetical protein